MYGNEMPTRVCLSLSKFGPLSSLYRYCSSPMLILTARYKCTVLLI